MIYFTVSCSPLRPLLAIGPATVFVTSAAISNIDFIGSLGGIGNTVASVTLVASVTSAASVASAANSASRPGPKLAVCSIPDAPGSDSSRNGPALASMVVKNWGAVSKEYRRLFVVVVMCW